MLSHAATNRIKRFAEKNSHVEANGKLMLATEDAKTWEEMEGSLTLCMGSLSACC